MIDDPMTDWPEVTKADSFADQQWFFDHPGRRYHVSPLADGRAWVIRRRGRDTFLRTLTRLTMLYADTDEALRQLWFETVYRELDPLECEALVKEARKAERSLTRWGERRGAKR